MQLGWVDFSKEDREKVLDVVNLLQEQGAVDELGIGLIRDAFANYFFPGTSTVQTRAKYFLIVPYILQEAIDGRYGNNPNTILRRIDEAEKDCGLRLYQKIQDSGQSAVGIGIIGARVLPRGWVARRPSNIYWNGIRTYHIFEQGSMSIPEMVKLSVYLRSQEKSVPLGNRNDDADEGDKDDMDAGRDQKIHFFDLPDHPKSWKDTLTISLTGEEAEFLRKKITSSVPTSLLTFILKNNVDMGRYQMFEALCEDLKNEVSEELAHMMELACDFNRLVFAARVRYNVILSRGFNQDAAAAWADIISQPPSYCRADLEDIFVSLKIMNARLRSFLINLKAAMLEKNEEKMDEIIRAQEIRLKTLSRAKLAHADDYDPSAWVGGTWLDYRFSDARQIVSDIYEGEGGLHVSH